MLRDKEQLTRFRAGIFLKHFARIILSPEECDIMRLLAFHSPLPLGVIATVLGIDPRALASMLVRLIDFAFVIATEESLYRIADPLTEATGSAFGVPSAEQHRAVARSLSRVLGEMAVGAAYLQLSRVMFRSASMAGDQEIASSATHLAGDLIRLAQDLYHARRYSEVIAIARAALEERRTSTTARGYLVRALIQEERWEEAEEQIDEMTRHAPERDVLYLRGFLERKRGNLERAIDHYAAVQRLGRRGAALSRELAICYFFTGNYEEASRHIEIALREHGDNRYVIDLAIRLAVAKRDEKGARRGLLRLERVENEMFFMHRTSRVELAFGNVREAKDAAAKAVKAEANPPFEVVAQLVHCELEVNNAAGAESALEILDRRFGHIRNDVRNGLRCRLDIARGRHNEALARAEQIRDKESPFYKKIRRDALTGSLRSGLRDAERSAREQEIAALERELREVEGDKLAPADLDSPTRRG